jgi:molybdopterin-guanine dinucleotide biosynthesis protein MobB
MKEPKVIAVVGGKSSGKTTTMEVLIRELTKRGYRVAAVKHVPEPNFTIDHAGKDTWRFAQSGAKTIISVAANEVATLEKVNPNDFSLKRILQKCRGNDIVFLEGFREHVGKDKSIPKIVVVKSAGEAAEAVKTFNPILAFAGPYSTASLKLAIPYIDVLKNPGEIADIVEAVVEKS